MQRLSQIGSLIWWRQEPPLLAVYWTGWTIVFSLSAYEGGANWWCRWWEWRKYWVKGLSSVLRILELLDGVYAALRSTWFSWDIAGSQKSGHMRNEKQFVPAYNVCPPTYQAGRFEVDLSSLIWRCLRFACKYSAVWRFSCLQILPICTGRGWSL